MVDYDAFLAGKRLRVEPSGFAADEAALPAALFDFQRAVVRWALKRGKAAIFANTGLGKTAMQLAWGDRVSRHAGGDVLILAPLAVARQTAREATKFGLAVTLCRDAGDVRPGVNVANYERLQLFDAAHFAGIVLDESSILKSYEGATRNAIIDAFALTPYKLACTATPAPNDHMELGNHAEFLGVMARVEMLAMFFTHDGGETQKWRLKGHAREDFWRWVCSWAVTLGKPSDLGYENGAFDLPPLVYHQHTIADIAPQAGLLFPVEAQTLTERRDARRSSLGERVARCVDIVNADDQPWVIWCDLNAEQDALARAFGDRAISVYGSLSPEEKNDRLIAWLDGERPILLSKPSICGFGINMQHCARVAFVGLSDSWEAYYQAIRRCWRFGQTRPVECHVITSIAEGAVVTNIKRKEREAAQMASEMVRHTREGNIAALGATDRAVDTYARQCHQGANWTMQLGDCVEVVRELGDAAIDFIVYSPPFASLYTYSNSPRDMGNVRDHGEFYAHFAYLTGELYRALKPGRLMAVHCMNIPTSKSRDGYIGISDFRGDLIRLFQDAGFIYHSEVVIWKDPVTAMQRTKALGLLYKQLRKDSAMSRQGTPDYLVVMRKPGDNREPVTKVAADFPVDLWQRYASPVWFDINPSETLQKESAREEQDERHIAPLQLEVIRRAIQLWTNPGDLVLSPFAGIGSEGYVALEEGRRFIGSELKRSYFDQAVGNLRRAAQLAASPRLFDMAALAADRPAAKAGDD